MKPAVVFNNPVAKPVLLTSFTVTDNPSEPNFNSASVMLPFIVTLLKNEDKVFAFIFMFKFTSPKKYTSCY